MLVDRIRLIFDGSLTTRIKYKKNDTGSYSVQIRISNTGDRFILE